ncbi:MAG: CorA family divalent cation transporter [Polyangiaceae bacterium]
MKNPLLVPELREMIETADLEAIREFFATTPAPMAAEFLAALHPREQRYILGVLESATRSLVFAELEEDEQLALLDVMPPTEGVELVARMPDEPRLAFLEGLPPEEQPAVRELLEIADSPLAEKLENELDAAIAEPKPEPEDLSVEEIASEIAPYVEHYRVVDDKVVESPRGEKAPWVNVVAPPKDVLPLLAKHFKIPVDFLTASLDIDETARVEVEDDATLIIVKVPYFDENNLEVLIFTIPIGVILVGDSMITVCSRPDSVLRDFIDNKVRHPAQDRRLILQIILRALALYLQHLKQLNNAANIIQKQLEQESRNKQLIKLFNIEKSLIYFTTSLKSNMIMLDRLKRGSILPHDDATENLLEDIFIEGKQAIEMATIYTDILSGMMSAFASVISNNLNIVMKLLTSLTIIITLPMLIASIFGMNVKLPMQDHPLAFEVVMGSSVLLCFGAVYYFLKRGWLER